MEQGRFFFEKRQGAQALEYFNIIADRQQEGTLDEAKAVADDGAAYTQQDIVIEDESLDGLFSCVGTISMNDDGISTIEDLNGGPSFGFKLVDQNDENATFYLGEDFGTVVLKPYEMGEFIGALKDIDDGTLFGA